MNKAQLLLAAGTVLSTVGWFQPIEAGVESNVSGKSALSSHWGTMLAQTQEPEPKPKPGSTSQKPPTGTVVKPPPVAPAPPQQKAVPAPPAAQSAPPVLPAVQGQPPAVPGRPVTPPAAQSAPPVPPAVQGQTPAVPGRPVTPPAAQTAPHAPPAARGQPPAVPGRPVTPPAAQSAPPVPPAVQGRPPAVPGRPVTPPAAQSGPRPAPAAGTTPNMQAAPLTPAGLPAPSALQAQPIAPAAAGAGIVPQSAQGQPLRRIDELRGERRETTEGGRTIIREPDRTIITEGGQTIIRHSEVDRFRYGAQDVRTERRGDDTVTVIVRPNGDRVLTTLDENGFLLRRSRILPDGREIIIIDNRPRPGRGYRPEVGYGGFFVDLPPPVILIPRDRYIVETETATPALLYETLLAPPVEVIDRPYSLDEIRYSAPLRDRMPRIDLNTVTFDSGSWELSPDQIEQLAGIAASLNRAIEVNPREVFLIEGYTDAVGSDVDNLSLSDRRAESVAIVLTQQFGVLAENLSTQGYGKQFLKVPTDGPERANRRVTVRRITPLLTGQAR